MVRRLTCTRHATTPALAQSVSSPWSKMASSMGVCRTVLDLSLPSVPVMNERFFYIAADVMAETFSSLACVYLERVSDTAIAPNCR
ncbi:hypothetical protein TNCV_3037091 [Trichonephila clavipes]|nr:hypothetical protein TNCV_3037091 [Trichonephila clavipes]